jgi:hypothetical protein
LIGYIFRPRCFYMEIQGAFLEELLQSLAAIESLRGQR